MALPFIDPGKAYTTVKELAPALWRDGLYPSQSEGEPTLKPVDIGELTAPWPEFGGPSGPD